VLLSFASHQYLALFFFLLHPSQSLGEALNPTPHPTPWVRGDMQRRHAAPNDKWRRAQTVERARLQRLDGEEGNGANTGMKKVSERSGLGEQVAECRLRIESKAECP